MYVFLHLSPRFTSMDRFSVYNGYNSQDKDQIDWQYDDHSARIDSWKSVAEIVLPRMPGPRLVTNRSFELRRLTFQERLGRTKHLL